MKTPLLLLLAITITQAVAALPDAVGLIQARTSDNEANKGLFTLTSERSGITSRHIVEGIPASKIVVKLRETLYRVESVELPHQRYANAMPAIENDYVFVKLAEQPNVKPLAIESTPPRPGDSLTVAIERENKLESVQRTVNHVGGYGLVSDDTDRALVVGDSGGAWINQKGNLVAITARVLEDRSAFATGFWRNPVNACLNAYGYFGFALLFVGIVIFFMIFLRTPEAKS